MKQQQLKVAKPQVRRSADHHGRCSHVGVLRTSQNLIRGFGGYGRRAFAEHARLALHIASKLLEECPLRVRLLGAGLLASNALLGAAEAEPAHQGDSTRDLLPPVGGMHADQRRVGLKDGFQWRFQLEHARDEQLHVTEADGPLDLEAVAGGQAVVLGVRHRRNPNVRR